MSRVDPPFFSSLTLLHKAQLLTHGLAQHALHLSLTLLRLVELSLHARALHRLGPATAQLIGNWNAAGYLQLQLRERPLSLRLAPIFQRLRPCLEHPLFFLRPLEQPRAPVRLDRLGDRALGVAEHFDALIERRGGHAALGVVATKSLSQLLGGHRIDVAVLTRCANCGVGGLDRGNGAALVRRIKRGAQRGIER